MLLLPNINCCLHELKNETKFLIHERSLFKQLIVLIIVFQKTLKSLFTSEFQRFLRTFIYYRILT